MRGVQNSCKRMGGWKKWRFGETQLISWRRGGFENTRTPIGACWRERDGGSGIRICQSGSSVYVPSSWELCNGGFCPAGGRGGLILMLHSV